jgi:methyl-accepting chemotaxis protein
VASQQTADSLRQSSMAIEQLNDASRGLQSGVARFTLAA